MTNGDFIRSMPDSVLVKFLARLSRHDPWDDQKSPCSELFNNAQWCSPICKNNFKCESCMQEWISSERKK